MPFMPVVALGTPCPSAVAPATVPPPDPPTLTAGLFRLDPIDPPPFPALSHVPKDDGVPSVPAPMARELFVAFDAALT